MDSSRNGTFVRDTLPVLLLAVATPLLLLLTRSAQQTGDALLYAYSIRTGDDLFHPHHLLYAPVVRLLYLGLAPFLPEGRWDALAAAQLHGVLWATIAVVCCCLTLRRVLRCRALAWIGALALLFSQGFWMLATHANSYVPVLGCLSLVLWRLARREEPPGPSTRELVLISLVWALSILYHQINVLFAIPLLYYLRAVSGRSPLRSAAPAVLPAALLSAGAYLAVVLARGGGAGGFLGFSLDYALHPNPTWGTLRNLGPSGLAALLTNQAWGLMALHRALQGVLVVLVALLLVLIVVWHVRQIRQVAPRSSFRVMLLLWLATYLAFYWWWLPQHKPFFVLTSLPILLLAVLALDDIAAARPHFAGRRAAVATLGALVAAFGLFHLLAVILPLHAMQRPAHDEARSLDEQVSRDCYIMTTYEVAQSLRYHFDRPRAAHARFPLLCTYQEQPIPEVFEIRGGQCVVIAAAYLRPDRDVYGYDGYSNPDRWEAYLDWLFDFRRDGSGAVLEVDDVRVLRTANGADYVAIGPGRRPVAGLTGLLRQLDALGALAPSWRDGPFTRWLARGATGEREETGDAD